MKVTYFFGSVKMIWPTGETFSGLNLDRPKTIF